MKCNFLSKTVFAAVLALTTNLIAEMPEPYRSLKDLPFDPHGWFSNQKQISECLESIAPQTVIEVGSWLGKSTRFIAKGLPIDAKLYAVDNWLGWEDCKFQQKDPRLPQLFHIFLSNVKHEKLTDVIVPIRMNSLEAAKALNVQADLIYIDACHDTESVYNDIMAWYPHLNEGGIMCGDDWHWPSVRRAVNKARHELNLSVYSEGNFWKFE